VPHLSPETIADQSILFDHQGGLCVATLAEPILRDHLAPIVGNRLLELAHQSRGNLVVKHDLVREFSSAWINEMLRLTAHCDGLGGLAVMASINPNGVRILTSTGISRRLHLADHEAAARELFVLRSGDDGTTVLGWIFGSPARRSA
jgi:hypothetical protein